MPKSVASIDERLPQTGPAMARLDRQRQLFVWALLSSGGNRAAAARACGWNKMKGSRLGHDPEVQAAIGEVAREHLALYGPGMIANMAKLATSAESEETRRKATADLLSRGGLGAVVLVHQQHVVEHQHPSDDLPTIQRLWEKMLMLGIDPVPLLGARRAALMKPVVTDAEYAEGLPEPEPATKFVEEDSR